MAISNKVFLLLGSNINPRIKYLKNAEKLIGENIGNITKLSKIYESKSLGFNSDIDFINRVIEVSTDLSAIHVLEMSLEIESKLGRKRDAFGYSSRTIDIDILYYNDLIFEDDKLTIPHPRLHERRFTLIPLVEMAPDFNHPVFNMVNQQLLNHCLDNSVVNVYNH